MRVRRYTAVAKVAATGCGFTDRTEEWSVLAYDAKDAYFQARLTARRRTEAKLTVVAIVPASDKTTAPAHGS